MVLSAFAGQAFAQQAAVPSEADDPAERPTEHGIRLTPGMARSFAGVMAKEVFASRYELDESKRAQATEAIARRIMQLAHKHEERGQEFFEFVFATALEAQSERRNRRGPPSGLVKGIGERILPVMPDIREAANGIMQDVRPMLSFKQQLKMTADVAMVNVALDAFEKNMQKWASGETIDATGNPFESEEQRLKKDENGQTQTLRNALSRAEAQSKRAPGSEWDEYVEEAKKYYELDSSQAAMADSILRDYKERAKAAVGGEDAWKATVYRNRLWSGMSLALAGRWNNPLRALLDRELQQVREPLDALGDELKDRIDAIPTQAQRDAAERRLMDAFRQKDLPIDPPEVAATSPAAHAEDAQ